MNMAKHMKAGMKDILVNLGLSEVEHLSPEMYEMKFIVDRAVIMKLQTQCVQYGNAK